MKLCILIACVLLSLVSHQGIITAKLYSPAIEPMDIPVLLSDQICMVSVPGRPEKFILVVNGDYLYVTKHCYDSLKIGDTINAYKGF